MDNNVVDIRFIIVKDNVYFRKEDVLDIIREVAGSEETDVYKRFDQLARSLSEIGL